MPQSWELDREGRHIRFPWRDVRIDPGPVPSSDIHAGPFRRVCINVDWAKHVAGAIDRLSDRDAWSGTESEIDRAIAAVDEIFLQLGAVLEACPEQGETVTEIITETVVKYIGGGSIESEEDMGQVVTEVRFDSATGLLYVHYGHCCVEEFDLTGIVEGQQQPDDDDLTPIPSEETACRKAYWMAHEMARFLEVMWDEYASGTLIWAWAADVRSQMSGYKLSDWSMFKLFEQIQVIWAVGALFADYWTEVNTQKLVCLYYPHLNNTDYTLTEDEYNAIKSTTGNVGNEVFEVIIRTAFDALNWSNFQRMAAFSQGITVNEGDCDCPDEGSPIASYDWDYKYDLQASQNGWYPVNTHGSWVSGLGLQSQIGTGAQGRFSAPDRTGGDYAGTINLIEVELVAASGNLNVSTYGYIGSVIFDDFDGARLILEGNPDWAAGSGLYSSGLINEPYGAYTNQGIHVAMRIEDQSQVGFWIRRVRIAGTGEPLITAPVVAYS